jgi:hypothetical protein
MNAMRGAALVFTGAAALASAVFAGGSDPIARSYSGIDLVDRDGGLVVWTLRPGPLDGSLVSSRSLARGDLLLTIDGAPATRALWDAAHQQPAGARVRLGYRPARAPDETREVEVVLEEAARWRGLLHRETLPPLPDTRLAAAHAQNTRGDDPAPAQDAGSAPTKGATQETVPDDLRREFAQSLDALGPAARARVDKLVKSLATIPDGYRDPSTPPLLRTLFAQPAAAESLVVGAVPSAELWRDSPFRAAARLTAALGGAPDAELPPAHGVFEIAHADAGVWFLDFLLNEARVRFAGEVDRESARLPGLRPLVVERLDELLVRGANSRAAMEALAKIPELSPVEAARIVAHFDVAANLSPEVARGEAAEVPDALRGAVDGTILAASEIPELGWLVVGGPGANRYDLGRIAAVLELGGDDRFEWTSRAGEHRLVVDLDGNDLHVASKESAPDAANGPAAALGAIAVIDDHRGDDRYEGGALTAGAALGIALLVDRAGNDRYSGGAWSLGAAAGGAALVVDLAGNDTFAGEGMALGVGGPSGVGVVVDVAGDDRSTLGTRPSVYGVEGEHAGFGMGLGLGFRLAAAGGVGAYIDLAGNDERRSGEFSQGCGYFLGLGILLDADGDDRAECDRYGLGSAAHQAIGVAIDRRGNDRFIGHTAAHLGGAWDESIAVFVDLAGDDESSVGSLSLGGAAQQALGLSVDRAGADRRTAGGASLGASSTNEYHFAKGGLGSFGAFLDLAGLDLYPAGRADDTTVVTVEAPAAELREQDGAFLDTGSKDAGSKDAGSKDARPKPAAPEPAATPAPATEAPHR